VNDEIHIPLQDGVNGPSISLLDVDLALVAARLGIELRVPRVAEVCIRDVGYPYDLIPLFNPVLFRPKHMMDLPGPQFRVWCLAIRPDLWQQVVRYLHEGLIPILEGVFGGRLCFGLMSIPTL
jgi:hypothetical protein